jgi:uncharacterized protein YndB with AHSA1/START domain
VYGRRADRRRARTLQLANRAEIEIARPIEEVFDLACACDGFPRFLFPFGPIPGVASSAMVDAPTPKPGARRDVHMTDGSTMQEEILAFDRPSRHRYCWLNRPAPPFSWLVRGGEGDWTFSATPTGTRIVWVYRFELTSPLVLVVALPVMLLFRRWMQRGLASLPAALASAR